MAPSAILAALAALATWIAQVLSRAGAWLRRVQRHAARLAIAAVLLLPTLAPAQDLQPVPALTGRVVDTAGRTLIPMAFQRLMPGDLADNAGPAVASILIYLLMAAVLFWKPRGLFPSHG